MTQTMSNGQNYTRINLKENDDSGDGDEPPPDISELFGSQIFNSSDLIVEEETLYVDPPGTFSINLGLIGVEILPMEIYKGYLFSNSGYH